MVLPDHRRLSAYYLALDVAIRLDALACDVKRKRWSLGDQLDRASKSIILNLAEGAGEFSPGAKAQSYRIARRSATECMAALDLVERIIRPPLPVEPARSDIQRLLGMLTVLVKSME